MNDVAVIGAGTAGLTVARLTARRGKRVVLIERDRPGGDCLWTGCVPTKALVHVAAIAHHARTGTAFGVRTENVDIDYAAVRDHIARSQNAAGHADTPEAIAAWGVELVRGEARFVDAETIQVGERRIEADIFVIATGSRPAIPPIPGIAEAGFDTNETIFGWRSLPKSLAVIGGGPIGVEFAQALGRLGVRVTVIEQSPRILDREEPAASETIERVLQDEGIVVRTSSRVTRVDREHELHRLAVESARGVETIEVERLLVATGRRANVEHLNLEAAGIRMSRAGVGVDRHLRTSQPNVYAAGDVNGSPQFTHVAEDQGRTIAKAILSSRGRLRRDPAWDGRVVPRVTYTDPEVASVGLTEAEARSRRRGVHTWTVPLSEVDRAVTMGAREGFLKLVTARGWQSRIPGLASRVGDEIVGACFVGPGAGDLLMPVVMAMRARLPVGMVAWNMQAYPTLALGVRQVSGLPFESPAPAVR